MARLVRATTRATRDATQAGGTGWMELAQHSSTLRGDEDPGRDQESRRWRVRSSFLSCASSLNTLLYKNNQAIKPHTTQEDQTYVQDNASRHLRRSNRNHQRGDDCRQNPGGWAQQAHSTLTLHNPARWIISCASSQTSILYTNNQAITPQSKTKDQNSYE